LGHTFGRFLHKLVWSTCLQSFVPSDN
jgi:hypothetical protein